MDVSGDSDPLSRGIPKVQAGEGIVVLGAPVGHRAFTRAKLEERVEKVRQITELLPLLEDPHSEFVLLRSCLALPKVMFNLRAVNTMDHQDVLVQYDSITRGALSRILGTPVSDLQWAQSKLPVAMGGLGLRAATDHASVAHATSLLGAHSLAHDLLGQGARPPNSQNEPGGQASNPQGELPLPRLPLPLLQDITAKQGEETLVTVNRYLGCLKKWQV